MMLVGALVFFLIAGCGSSSGIHADAALTQSDAGSTVSIQKGQTLAVSLHGNGSTGFLWEVEPGSESILEHQPERFQFVPDNTGPHLAGSGGTYTRFFKAIAPGTASLKLANRGPGETGVAPMETFEVTIVVGS